MKKQLGIVGLLGLSLMLVTAGTPELAPPPDGPPPDVIFFNGDILTMDRAQPVARAIAVRGDEIVAVGDMGEVMRLGRRGTQRVNLRGRTLMPGFVDAHTHILNEPAYGSTLEERQEAALANGITTMGILYTDDSFLADMQAFDDSGDLRVRASLYLVYNNACGDVVGDWYLDHPPSRVAGETLRIGGVKVYADGGTCNSPSFTEQIAPDAVVVPPYVTVRELTRVIRDAQAVRHQVAIHAIGDSAIDVALDSVENALGGGRNVYRHRIEHNSVVRRDQLSRYGDVGVVATIFADYPSCAPFGEPLFEEYWDWEWPYDELVAANPGLHVAWHGDAPFFSLNPLVQLFGFVTRHDVDESDGSICAPLPHLADDTFPVRRALYMMTVESAYALFRENEVGSLKPGMLADMIVLSDNPARVDSFAIKDIEVLMTMVGGEVAYCAPGAESVCP